MGFFFGFLFVFFWEKPFKQVSVDTACHGQVWTFVTWEEYTNPWRKSGPEDHRIIESLPTEESEGLTHGAQHPWRNFWFSSFKLKKTPNYMGWSIGPAGVNVKPSATVGSGFHPWSNSVRIYFGPTRKKKGRFFICASLFLSLFRVFFAPLSACTVQEGIWPSAAKA